MYGRCRGPWGGSYLRLRHLLLQRRRREVVRSPLSSYEPDRSSRRSRRPMLRARHSYQCALSAGHQRVPCRFPELRAKGEL